MTVPKETVAARAADMYIWLTWKLSTAEPDRIKVISDKKQLMELTYAIATLEEYREGKGYMIEDVGYIKDEIRALVQKHNIKVPEKYEDPEK